MSLDSTTITILAAVILLVVVLVTVAIALRGREEGGRRGDPYVAGLRALIDGNRNEAYSSLQRSVKTGKAPTDAYIRLGNMLREHGEPAKALQIHRSLTVSTGLTRREKKELFVNIAQDYSKLGNADQAVRVLESAVSSMGLKDPEVWRLLSKEYNVLGKTEEAYRCLKEMKRSGAIGDRELSFYLSSVGERIAEDGDPKEARKILQRALKHDSSNPAAQLALGNLEENLGNEEGALEHWKMAAMSSPELSVEALKSLERVMFQHGTFGDIERIYRKVLDARPWDEYTTLALASFYRKQGRGSEAIEFLEEFRGMHPESVGATALLTSLYATHKDTEFLEKFLEENENAIAAAARSGRYICSVCGFQSTSMRWHCPRCNSFDSYTQHNET